MNIIVKFESSSASAIASLREAYLDELLEPQEMLLEVLTHEAQNYLILAKGKTIGYLIVHNEHTLIEFYLNQENWLFNETIVQKAIKELHLRKALIKSFDHLFLSAAIEHQVSLRVRGLLVRDYVPRELPQHKSIRYQIRPGVETDIPDILNVEQEVFTDPKRIEFVVAKGLLHVFYQDSTLVGFGIIRPIIPGRDDVDLGIAVDTPFRNKGYAMYMMRDLVLAAKQRGLRPLAGCSSDNPASRRMGERIGLVSRHRLLELSFQ